MNEATVIGIVSVLLGLLVCLRGYVALRVIISLLGAWVGFFLCAALVANVTGDGLFGAALGWLAAIVGAIVLGLLAYAFYQVAVLLGMGSLGFSIATGIATTLGVDSPLIIWLVGGAAAVLMVVIALVTDLPAGILILLTALAGASITVTGLLVLLGHITVADLETGRVPDGAPAWSGILALVLAVVGIVVQWRGTRHRRMRAAWSDRRIEARR